MIEPIGYNVLVRPAKVQEQTAGGLYKPDTVAARERYRRNCGVIEALGEMAFTFDDWPEGREKPGKGDTVYFSINDSTELWEGDDEYLVLADKDIIAVRGAVQ